MKRFLLVFFALCATCFIAHAQADSLRIEKKDTLILSSKDSLYLNHIAYLSQMATYNQPRYKLYKTQNIYNLIKLDTATGRLWQVQYGMNNSSDRMEVTIDDTSLLWSWEEPRAGRYELYPTENMYTFILLDTEKGRTYQVQWNTEPKKRFRIAIY